MKKLLVVLIPALLILNLGCRIEQVSVPAYVVPVVRRDMEGVPKGVSNAIMVDKKLGLLATNAHVVSAEHSGLDVKIGKFWYKVRSDENWINWEADLALVRLIEKPFDEIAESTLKTTKPAPGDTAITKGYLAKFVTNPKKDVPVVFQLTAASVKSEVIKAKSNICITLPDCKKTLELLKIFATVGAVDLEFLFYFYENYITIRATGNSYTKGMSGSPLLDADESVLGIISRASPHKATIVPADEIALLLDRARTHIKE